jgi:hypothetical protein
MVAKFQTLMCSFAKPKVVQTPRSGYIPSYVHSHRIFKERSLRKDCQMTGALIFKLSRGRKKRSSRLVEDFKYCAILQGHSRTITLQYLINPQANPYAHNYTIMLTIIPVKFQDSKSNNFRAMRDTSWKLQIYTQSRAITLTKLNSGHNFTGW